MERSPSSQDLVLTTLLQGPLISSPREPRPCQVLFLTQKGTGAYKNSALQVQNGPLRVGGKTGEEVAAPAAALFPSWGRRAQFVSLSDNNRCVQPPVLAPREPPTCAVPRASQGSLGSPPHAPFSVSISRAPRSPFFLSTKVPSTIPTPPPPLPTPVLAHFHCPASHPLRLS